MYCAVCGTPINTELNFCNRCGTKVSKVDLEIQKTGSENLSSAVGYIGGFGFLGFVFVTLILVKNGAHAVALTAISLFYLSALFGICYLIIQRASSLSGNPALAINDLPDNLHPEQLGSVNTAQLESPRQPAMSVTESTTRTLEKVSLRK